MPTTQPQPDNQDEPRLALVTEAFLDWPLPKLLDWLLAEAPEIRALEIGSGGYAPHPHLRPGGHASRRRAAVTLA